MCAPPTTPETAATDAARNLRIAYTFTLAAGAARGVWSYAVLSGYLYVLTGGSNARVGLAEGAQGIAQCACGLLAGWAADRFRRQTVCRVACVTGVVASLGLILSIAVSDVSARARFDYVTVGLAAFGAYQGVWSTALETLFADSTAPGAHRAAATARKFGFTLLATTAGPALALILFLCIGDDWSLAALRTVAVVGLALCAPPALLLLGLRDVGADACDDEDEDEAGDEGIARLILVADLISGFGSGMTVKFIPLFFKNRAAFSPVAANALSIGAALVMICGSRVCEKWSQSAGKARVCAACMVLAAIALLGLAWADAGRLNVLRPGRPALTSTIKRAGAVVLYLITCAQHACRPLKKAALNDHVPHNARGRWNALDGVTRFGWSGSAVLGGYLVDRGGYALTFVVTAATQLIAALVWLALIGRVDPHAAGLVPRRRAPTEDSLEEPLMEDAAPTTRATSGSFVVDDYSEMPRG